MVFTGRLEFALWAGGRNQVVVASFVLLLWLFFLLGQISLYSFKLGIVGLVLDAVSLL